MPWMIVCAVGSATAGLLVLSWSGFRVWLAVRRLSREVDTAARAVARAASDLERAAATRGGGLPPAASEPAPGPLPHPHAPR
jgi:hypothetical protein